MMWSDAFAFHPDIRAHAMSELDEDGSEAEIGDRRGGLELLRSPRRLPLLRMDLPSPFIGSRIHSSPSNQWIEGGAAARPPSPPDLMSTVRSPAAPSAHGLLHPATRQRWRLGRQHCPLAALRLRTHRPTQATRELSLHSSRNSVSSVLGCTIIMDDRPKSAFSITSIGNDFAEGTLVTDLGSWAGCGGPKHTRADGSTSGGQDQWLL
ncbi:hypothetical protein EJB05_33745 [Eragrostis curvula]|uniref:Uncharacterized protein n=1 Tax=Eragrostis curvula TaxID=38414 RepID=A0A5J9U262_9POAL|nr:hypothetical protein EJB05_33745 [Eragrostis curvula]